VSKIGGLFLPGAGTPQGSDPAELTTYTHRFRLPASREEVFALFADPYRLDQLTPDWFRLLPVEPVPSTLSPGTEIAYRLRWRGLPLHWTSRITEWGAPERIVYEQARGPYRSFLHDHRFVAIGRRETEVVDRIDFRTAGGPWFDRRFVRADLRRIFEGREARARRALALASRRPDSEGEAVDLMPRLGKDAPAPRPASQADSAAVPRAAASPEDETSGAIRIPLTRASSSAIDRPV
jgi:ligand-binding SRPBCC domain-containing protein